MEVITFLLGFLARGFRVLPGRCLDALEVANTA
jgi:hypothetical protein